MSTMQEYERLEHVWAEVNNLDPKGMVACNSGTAALHLALEALPIPPQSTVLVPDFTMIACARAVTLSGRNPKFIDCDNISLNLDPLQVPYNDDTAAAILVVHTYGRHIDFHKSRQLGAGPNWCWKDGLYIIEDLAECHGVTDFVGMKVQPDTHAACWSFYKNKVVHGEEGGAVWFRDPSAAAKARRLRCLGFTDSHDFMHIPRGHNYRLANLLATPILDSIHKMESNLRIRRELEEQADRYCPDEWKQPYRDVPWVYDFRIRDLTYEQQNHIIATLRSQGIQARHAFKPMSSQREYYDPKQPHDFNLNAYAASREVIYLPLDPLNPIDYKSAFELICSVVSI